MSKKTQSTPAQDPAPDLTAYMEVISRRFRPAANETEATHRLSTEEISGAIKSLNPGLQVNSKHVYDAMQNAGFKFSAAKGTQSLIFKWLLVEK
jgi:hypothetical protein